MNHFAHTDVKGVAFTENKTRKYIHVYQTLWLTVIA
jgi:hypothetical protein